MESGQNASRIWLARWNSSTLVPNRLRRVTCEDLQLYQYPGDLLLRGKSDRVAKVRAMLSRTRIDEHAYLVQSDAAQRLQDRLSELGHRMDRGATTELAGELTDLYRDTGRADIPYDDWTILDGLARKLERRMIGAEKLVPELPLDQVGDVPASATA